jgi:hypothetical protein
MKSKRLFILGIYIAKALRAFASTGNCYDLISVISINMINKLDNFEMYIMRNPSDIPPSYRGFDPYSKYLMA